MNEENERIKDPMPGKSATLQEEAEFWDTHDVADYWDEMKPAKLELSKNLAHGIVVRFSSDTLTKVYETACMQGVTMDALIQKWVVERLNQQKGSGDC